MKVIVFYVLATSIVISGCNTPPSRIAPIHQSSNQYANYDCKKLSKTLSHLDTTISAQKSQLQSDANMDAGIVAGSLILLPVGLFALAATGNGNLKNEYAKNLGKQSALKEVIEEKECDI